MKPVVIESPYAGRHGSRCSCDICGLDVQQNLRYLRACLKDSLLRGEAPFASHGLYTRSGVLDDTFDGDRQLGIDAGFAWAALSKYRVFYVDRGVSSGMLAGARHAVRCGQILAYRELPEWRMGLSTFDDAVYQLRLVVDEEHDRMEDEKDLAS